MGGTVPATRVHYAVLGLDVDDGLGSRTTLCHAPDGSRDAADQPRDADPEPVRVVVAAVPLSTWMRRAPNPATEPIAK
jgi:hypothetical protein